MSDSMHEFCNSTSWTVMIPGHVRLRRFITLDIYPGSVGHTCGIPKGPGVLTCQQNQINIQPTHIAPLSILTAYSHANNHIQQYHMHAV